MASQLPVTMPPKVRRLLGWLYSARGWTNLALVLNWLGWMALLSGLVSCCFPVCLRGAAQELC